ncbi:MAG: hypothetical protein JNL87_04730 [Burkholderiaceae bacterium]|nr:hypothetical protein [Burkholderiaceae bacterium]
MTIIAYQSFNANSSSSHGLAATSLQRFTRDTNRRVTQEGHEALVLPTLPTEGGITAPVYGPAHLRPIETLGPLQPVNVFGAQIALLWQNFYRAFGDMPDILVCGEIDMSHPDFTGLVIDENVKIENFASTKACQSFTAISQSPLGSKALMNGEGFVVYLIAGMVVVFVHVPNRIARDFDATRSFYWDIAQAIKSHGAIIHLVIGDTNQSSFDFTAQALNAAFETSTYKNASDSAQVSKIDNYNVVERGTNSSGNKMYDVCVFRTDLVRLKKGPVYLSQSSGAVTVTDHCGLGVQVERK